MIIDKVRRAIRDAYDPLHTIKVIVKCTKCTWKDEFLVQPKQARKKRKL